MSTCSVCGLEFKPTNHSAGKYCSQKCYQSVPKHRIPLEDRFWKYVQKSDGCWLWIGSNDGDQGYGRCQHWLGGKTVGAHRASWILHFGEIPKGLQVCHYCDNPPCVRPDHLFLGTNRENSLDCVAKGRRTIPDNRGSNHGMSKLTEDSVREIRGTYIPWKRGNKAELASRFGVSVSAINNILWGNYWTHVK